jgi:hypothetical protein
MARGNWRKPTYWRWFWHERVSVEVKALSGVALLALMLGGGWVAADRLSTAGASVDGGGAFTVETTVQKIITVREKGKLVRKLVPVVKKVYLRPRTAFLTQTAVRTNVVTVSGGVRTVRSRVVVRVPVVSKKVVTVDGKTRTVVTTRLMRTTAVETQMHTLTQVQTQMQTQVQTETQTQVQVQVQTQTVVSTATRTVTQPVTTTVPVTVTQTATVPVTVTQTVTVSG